MLMRASALPKNQSAGRGDEAPLLTVHQSPPKKIAPRAAPATHASASISVSFTGIVLFLPHGTVFLGDPVPRIDTAEREPGHQQRQRPGVRSRMVFVQP